MNRILKIMKMIVVDETGGETAEWSGVVGIIIAMAVAVYGNGGFQVAIQSAIDSIVNTITSIAP